VAGLAKTRRIPSRANCRVYVAFKSRHMDSDLYKCCLCLNTVTNPVVMCYQTHISCFSCICDQLEQSTTHSCALCRQSLHVRFDRLIQETSQLFHTSNKRKRSITNTKLTKWEVFHQLLEVTKRPKYRTFTKTLINFVRHTGGPGQLEQIHEDIAVVKQARIASARLIDCKLLKYNRNDL
jgi:hypothetical protein